LLLLLALGTVLSAGALAQIIDIEETPTPLLDSTTEVPAGLAPLVEQVKGSCLRLIEAVGRSSPALEKAFRSAQPPGVIADQVASAILPDPPLRQELLETMDVKARLRRLGEALDHLLREVTGGREGKGEG